MAKQTKQRAPALQTKSPAKPFKVGIICEGQFGGAEELVFPHLIKLICPGATRQNWEIVPSGNRPKVLQGAPAIAQKLFASGCAVVFVVWDTHPAWPDEGGTTDCRVHRRTLDGNLDAAGMRGKPVVAIAIRQMLEAWLIADGDALGAAMSRGPHRVTTGHVRNPDDINAPKVQLQRLFRDRRVGQYNESVDAGRIAGHLITTQRLRRSQSFARFENKLTPLCPDMVKQK